MECYFPCIRDLDTVTACGATFSHGFTCNTSSAKILAVSLEVGLVSSCSPSPRSMS